VFLQRQFFLRHHRSVTSTSSYANYSACVKKSMFQSTRTALFVSVCRPARVYYDEHKRMRKHRARGYKVKRMFSPTAGRVFALQVAVSGLLRNRFLHDPIRRESKFQSTVAAAGAT
jgi:hypothetical protein